jgi:ribosomal protein S12 methylthiotransferase accessory factor
MADTTELIITLPGGKKVDAAFDGFVVKSDQPVANGGEASAPSPFQLFLSSLGTCAGIYVAGFCQKRGVPTEGIRLVQRNRFDPESGVLAGVDFEIQVPKDFPEKYYEALVRVVDQCAVKRAIQAQPAFSVRTVAAG